MNLKSILVSTRIIRYNMNYSSPTYEAPAAHKFYNVELCRPIHHSLTIQKKYPDDGAGTLGDGGGEGAFWLVCVK